MRIFQGIPLTFCGTLIALFKTVIIKNVLDEKYRKEKKMMRMPVFVAKEKKKTLKYCTYLECGKEFYGCSVQKYCDFHTDPHHRKRIREKPEEPSVKNQVFFHHLNDPVITRFVCALDGCSEIFQVKIYPRQHVYPKYCDKHRSEYQRQYFTNNLRLKLAK